MDDRELERLRDMQERTRTATTRAKHYVARDVGVIPSEPNSRAILTFETYEGDSVCVYLPLFVELELKRQLRST